jgi:RNA polymerase sigma-70 factor (ECF subfamily)
MSDDPFVNHRGLLFTVAYEMLGSATDAEDVVQETWLRWAAIGDVARAELHDPRAYLVRMITRQALNRLRTLARQREEYVGAGLPEPLLTSPDVADNVELAESVSMAMLTVLETLGSAERAVFVLHEVFDVPYDEIAGDRQDASGGAPVASRRTTWRAANAGEPGRAGGRRGAVPGGGHGGDLQELLGARRTWRCRRRRLVAAARRPIEARNG